MREILSKIFLVLFATGTACSAGTPKDNWNGDTSNNFPLADAGNVNTLVPATLSDAPGSGVVWSPDTGIEIQTKQDAPLDGVASAIDVTYSTVPLPKTPYLGLSFRDLTTNVGPNDVYLWLMGPVPPSWLEQSSKQISLFTWPEHDPIPFTIVTEITTEMLKLSKIVVHFVPPTTEPRWYLIQVSPTNAFDVHFNFDPDPAAGYYRPDGPTPDGGSARAVGVRFMTTSQPRVHDVTEIHSPSIPGMPSTDLKLIISFSEIVDVEALKPHIQLAEPARSACALYIGPPSPPDKAPLPIGIQVLFLCTSSVINGLKFTVDSPVIINGPTFTVPTDAILYPYNWNRGSVYRFGLAR